jgi:hypothetical protein
MRSKAVTIWPSERDDRPVGHGFESHRAQERISASVVMRDYSAALKSDIGKGDRLGIFILCLRQKPVKIILAIDSPLRVRYFDRLHTQFHEIASFLDRFEGRGSLLRGNPDIGNDDCGRNHI